MIAGLTLLTFAIYWPVYRFGILTYDDPQYLNDNPHVRQGLTAAGFKDAFTNLHYDNYDPPLATLSFELDQQLFKLKPGTLHVENVLLHLLSGLLLWRFIYRATGKLDAGFAVAALFLCHPMHVESVAWIAERKDVLSTPLLLAAMLAYLRFCQPPAGVSRWCFYAVMLVLFTLSLLAKGMGVTLPAILLLLDYWPLQRWPGKSWLILILEKIPLLLISVILSAVQAIAQRQIGAYPVGLGPGARISNALVCYVLYIVKLTVPTGLAVFYPHPGDRPMAAVVAAAGLLMLVTAVCWRVRARMPWAIVGWLWFVGTLVPVIGLVQIGAQAMADRYSYLPSIGLLIAAVWTITRLIRSAVARMILLACIIGNFSVMAHRQVSYWRNNETLFAHAAEVTDDNALAQVELGDVAYDKGDLQSAVDRYTRAGDNIYAYRGLGNCWMGTDRSKAISYYRKALSMRPNSAPFTGQLARALRLDGQLDEAKKLATRAVELDPDDPNGRAELDRINSELANKKR